MEALYERAVLFEYTQNEGAMTGGKAGFRRISDESVRSKTDRGWDEWFGILDAWGASEQGHFLSAKHLREEYKISPWWAQAVTIRYEWERGLRRG